MTEVPDEIEDKSSKMPFTPEQKKFLKSIGGGLRVLMTCSYKSDDIATDPECPIEEFIRDNLMTDGQFSEAKFDTVVDTARDEDLVKLLKYFDDMDMYIKRVYYEASLPIDDEYASLVENGTLTTFEDFYNYC
jgi:predicted glycosyltransferase